MEKVVQNCRVIVILINPLMAGDAILWCSRGQRITALSTMRLNIFQFLRLQKKLYDQHTYVMRLDCISKCMREDMIANIPYVWIRMPCFIPHKPQCCIISFHSKSTYSLTKISTDENPADVFTKGLSKAHQHFIHMIGRSHFDQNIFYSPLSWRLAPSVDIEFKPERLPPMLL